MRVWKLEACISEERIGSRWGYAVASSAEEALAIARATSGLHEKHPEMRWPGASGEQVFWS